MKDEYVITVPSEPLSSDNPVGVAIWLAGQVQAGIWAVFLLSAIVAFLTRKHVRDALDSHFGLMESMKNAIEVNADNQTRNAQSQEQLAKVLSEMEVTDQITRKDVEEIKRTQHEILEYVSGIPSRRVLKPSQRQYLDELPHYDSEP